MVKKTTLTVSRLYLCMCCVALLLRIVLCFGDGGGGVSRRMRRMDSRVLVERVVFVERWGFVVACGHDGRGCATSLAVTSSLTVFRARCLLFSFAFDHRHHRPYLLCYHSQCFIISAPNCPQCVSTLLLLLLLFAARLYLLSSLVSLIRTLSFSFVWIRAWSDRVMRPEHVKVR